jgi:hypothetical protein
MRGEEIASMRMCESIPNGSRTQTHTQTQTQTHTYRSSVYVYRYDVSASSSRATDLQDNDFCVRIKPHGPPLFIEKPATISHKLTGLRRTLALRLCKLASVAHALSLNGASSMCVIYVCMCVYIYTGTRHADELTKLEEVFFLNIFFYFLTIFLLFLTLPFCLFLTVLVP